MKSPKRPLALDTSGEVSKKVIEEEEKINLQDIFNLVRGLDNKFERRLEVMQIKMDEALETRMRVQEARKSPSRSPPRSCESSLDPDKKVLALRTVKLEKEARTSLSGEFEDAEADSASKDLLHLLPMKTPKLGKYFA